MRFRLSRILDSTVRLAKTDKFQLIGETVALSVAWFLGTSILLAAVAAAFIFLANEEYSGRGSQTVVIYDPRSEKGPVVNLIIHEILPEEGAVEASVSLTFPATTPPRQPDKAECFILVVGDRSPEQVMMPKKHSFPCTADPAIGIPGGQTDRFKLPAYQSVQLFPFDTIVIWPYLNLISLQNDFAEPKYVITKFPPGRTISLKGDWLNWDIYFERSNNEKISILVSAFLFVSLTILLSWRIIMADSRLSAVQDLVAIASYMIAAVGFRELIGLDRTSGTSAFEIGVFILPLVLLTSGIFFSHIRHLLGRRTDAGRAGADV